MCLHWGHSLEYGPSSGSPEHSFALASQGGRPGECVRLLEGVPQTLSNDSRMLHLRAKREVNLFGAFLLLNYPVPAGFRSVECSMAKLPCGGRSSLFTRFSPLPSRVIGTAEVSTPEGLGLNGYNAGRQKLSRGR